MKTTTTLIWLFIIALTARAQQSFVVIDSPSENLEEVYQAYLESDKRGQTKIEIPIDDFVWIVLPLQDISKDEALIAQVLPSLDLSNAHLLDSRGELIKSDKFGELIPNDQAFLPAINRHLSILLLTEEEISTAHYLVLQIHNLKGQKPIKSVNIQPAFSWVIDYLNQDIYLFYLMFALLGVYGVFSLYNLFIYLMYRDKAYLFYGLYILSVALFLTTSSGVFRTLVWDVGMEGESLLKMFGIVAFLYTYLVFLKAYLKTYSLSKGQLKLHKAALYIILITIVIWIFVKLLFNVHAIRYLTVGIGVLTVLGIIVVLLITLWRRYGFVGSFKFFLLATLTMMILGIISGAMRVAYGDLVADPLLAVAMVIEILLFSLGLGYRMRENQQARIGAEQKTAQVLANQKEFLEKEVAERTAELKVQSEEILTQNEELHQQQEEIIAQRDHIEQTNLELASANQRTNDSIRYAETIQNALLPGDLSWKSYFNRLDILYRPKDIVSGDFYWYKEQEDCFWVVVADCTGHGVPGALMSVVGLNLLESLLNNSNCSSPSELLTQMDERFRTRFNQEEGENADGIDLSVGKFSRLPGGGLKMVYAGAKRSFIYLQNDQLQSVKGTSRSIGGLTKKDRAFANSEIYLAKGAVIILYTDGIVDQNNTARQKYGTTKLEQLLQEPLAENEQYIYKLRDSLDEHMENTTNRDDITVLVLEV